MKLKMFALNLNSIFGITSNKLIVNKVYACERLMNTLISAHNPNLNLNPNLGLSKIRPFTLTTPPSGSMFDF